MRRGAWPSALAGHEPGGKPHGSASGGVKAASRGVLSAPDGVSSGAARMVGRQPSGWARGPRGAGAAGAGARVASARAGTTASELVGLLALGRAKCVITC